MLVVFFGYQGSILDEKKKERKSPKPGGSSQGLVELFFYAILSTESRHRVKRTRIEKIERAFASRTTINVRW